MRRPRCLAPALCLFWLAACSAGLPTAAREPSRDALNPITGERLRELASEQDEISAAARQHAAIVSDVSRSGSQIDVPGAELTRARRIFADLVAVAHRAQLPWQLHWLPGPEVQAFTSGAGYVYLFDGIVGETGLPQIGSDAELAALLAHEIAHVALLHNRGREAWELQTLRARSNPYYSARFSAEQELEADRLAALYMALAGYDPRAALRMWQRAVRRFGSNPGPWLRDHPWGAARERAAADVGLRALEFYAPDRQNPNWRAVRDQNPLFPRTAEGPTDAGSARPAAAPRQAPVAAASPGRGVAAALKAALDSREAGAEQRPAQSRPAPSPLQSALRLATIQTGRESDGRRTIQIYLQNGAPRELTEVALDVHYYQGSAEVAVDPTCGGPAIIPAGAAGWLLCDLQSHTGANEFTITVSGARFR